MVKENKQNEARYSPVFPIILSYLCHHILSHGIRECEGRGTVEKGKRRSRECGRKGKWGVKEHGAVAQWCVMILKQITSALGVA